MGCASGRCSGNDAYCVMDACTILWNAIEHAMKDTGEITGAGIRDAIEKYSQDIDCLTATISIDPETHNVRRPIGIFKIENQNFVLVDTYDIAFG